MIVSRFLSFPRRRDRTDEQQAKERAWGEQKKWRGGEGVNEEEEEEEEGLEKNSHAQFCSLCVFLFLETPAV